LCSVSYLDGSYSSCCVLAEAADKPECHTWLFFKEISKLGMSQKYAAKRRLRTRDVRSNLWLSRSHIRAALRGPQAVGRCVATCDRSIQHADRPPLSGPFGVLV